MKTRDKISAVLFVGLIIVPAIFGGGRELIALPIFFILSFIYILLHKDSVGEYKNKYLWMILFSWMIWILISSIFVSKASYISYKLLVPIAGAFILYSIGIAENSKKYFTYTIIAGGSVFSLIGIINLLQSQNLGYIRLTSLFYQHNAFAGFIIVPIVLSLWWLYEKKETGLLYSYLAPILLFSSLFLTFSRGGMISTGGALIVFLMLLIFASESKKEFAKKFVSLFFIIIVSGGTAYGVYYAKQIQIAKFNTPIEQETALVGVGEAVEVSSPYKYETSSETGFTSRIEYWKTAFKLFKEIPLFGHGLGLYGQEARRVQMDTRFYSTDPHNLYLKYLSELGIIGAGLFFLFVGGVLLSAIKYIYKNKNDLLYGAFFAGFIGLLLHNGADVDFMFPANLFMFFAIASILSIKKSHSTESRSYIYYLIATITLFVLSISFYSADKIYRKATSSINAQGLSKFEREYSRAVFYDPFNINMSISASGILLSSGDTNKAEEIVDEVLRQNPSELRANMIKANILQLKENIDGALEYYKNAIEIAPYKNPDAVLEAVKLLIANQRKEDAQNLAGEALKRFPDNIFTSPLWVDPNKERIKKQIDYLKGILKE